MQRLADSIGIDHYEGIHSRSYIKGIRRASERSLYIAYGYTGGLVSEPEILDAVGDVDLLHPQAQEAPLAMEERSLLAQRLTRQAGLPPGLLVEQPAVADQVEHRVLRRPQPGRVSIFGHRL